VQSLELAPLRTKNFVSWPNGPIRNVANSQTKKDRKDVLMNTFMRRYREDIGTIPKGLFMAGAACLALGLISGVGGLLLNVFERDEWQWLYVILGVLFTLTILALFFATKFLIRYRKNYKVDMYFAFQYRDGCLKDEVLRLAKELTLKTSRNNCGIDQAKALLLAVYWALWMGYDLKDIQSWLSHSYPSLVFRYEAEYSLTDYDLIGPRGHNTRYGKIELYYPVKYQDTKECVGRVCW